MSYLETEVASVKDRQRSLDGKFSHMEENAKFVDEQLGSFRRVRTREKARSANAASKSFTLRRTAEGRT